MAVLRRLTFKQKVEAVSPRKPSQEMETSELSSFPSQSQQGHSPKEHTKKTSKKTRATQLKRAKLLGLVDKALKPFAIFCKEKKLQAKMASPLWKEMSPQEKDLYVKKSKETFEKQRAQSAAMGVNLRRSQLHPLLPPESFPDQSSKEEEKDSDKGTQTEHDMVLANKYIVKSEALWGAGAYGAVYVVSNKWTKVLYACKVETVGVTLGHEVEVLRKMKEHDSFLHIIDSCCVRGGLSWYVVPLMPLSLHTFLRTHESLGTLHG